MPSDAAQLGFVAGTAAASGLRLYGTVAVLGFLQRIGAVHLPGQLEVLGKTPIVVLATALYVIEFLADKVPLIDSVWDAVHTFLRVPAGAILGYAALSDVAEPWRAAAALLGGSIAFSVHGLKASARVALNASPEPFSNWAASLSEDVIFGVLLWLVVLHPVAALVAGFAALGVALLTASWLYRSFKRFVARRAGRAG